MVRAYPLTSVLLQKSFSDSSQVPCLKGFSDKMCYCFIVDHATGVLHCEWFQSKAPPIKYTNNWIAIHVPDSSVKDKYICMDKGGEMRKCAEIGLLLKEAGYSAKFTAPCHSHQNGLGKRPHWWHRFLFCLLPELWQSSAFTQPLLPLPLNVTRNM